MQYLNLSNPKLQQAVTKIRISAHKFPRKTGWYENKNVTQKWTTEPLCCEDIGDECHYLITIKGKEIYSVRNKFITPFFHNWKGTNKFHNEQFCRATLSYQNGNITPQTGLLCLKLRKCFKSKRYEIITVKCKSVHLYIVSTSF